MMMMISMSISLFYFASPLLLLFLPIVPQRRLQTSLLSSMQNQRIIPHFSHLPKNRPTKTPPPSSPPSPAQSSPTSTRNRTIASSTSAAAMAC